MSAQLVKRKEKLDNATECLESLHCLPIKYRIQHKVLTLVFKTIKGESPCYIQNLLEMRTNDRERLRSEKKYKEQIVPRTKRKTFADRSFSVQGPKLNELTDNIKKNADTKEFKNQLKTHLFTKALDYHCNIHGLI